MVSQVATQSQYVLLLTYDSYLRRMLDYVKVVI